MGRYARGQSSGAVNAVPLRVRRFESVPCPPSGRSSKAEPFVANEQTSDRYRPVAPIRPVSKSGDCLGLKNRRGWIETSAGHHFGESTGVQLILARSMRGVQLSVSPPSSGRRARCTRRSVKPSLARFDSWAGSHSWERLLTGEATRLSSGKYGIVTRRSYGSLVEWTRRRSTKPQAGVQVTQEPPFQLRVGKPGNPPALEAGDRRIEACHADQHGELAHLVERGALNAEVLGSKPRLPANTLRCQNGHGPACKAEDACSTHARNSNTPS
jgi:hypothetical protein